MLSRGLSPRTVLHAHRIVHSALAHAVKTAMLVRNVAEAVTPPRPESKELNTLSPEDVGRFLTAIQDNPYRAVFTTLLYTGARRSEVLALCWKDVDPIMGTISIRRTLQVLKGGKIVYGEPKSARGRRQIAMSPSPAIVLREHREFMEPITGPLADAGLVFTWEDGRPMLPDSISHSFAKVVRRLGLGGVRLHDLRHTHASLMLREGVHPKVVQERLGHSTISVTLDTYSHTTPGLQAAAAETFDKALAGAVPVNGVVDKN